MEENPLENVQNPSPEVMPPITPVNPVNTPISAVPEKTEKVSWVKKAAAKKLEKSKTVQVINPQVPETGYSSEEVIGLQDKITELEEKVKNLNINKQLMENDIVVLKMNNSDLKKEVEDLQNTNTGLNSIISKKNSASQCALKELSPTPTNSEEVARLEGKIRNIVHTLQALTTDTLVDSRSVLKYVMRIVED